MRKPSSPKSLKRIWRCARLVGSAAKELRTRALDALCNRKRLLAALNRTGSGDDRELRPANRGIAPGKSNDSVLFLNVAADQLVRFRDADDFLHARHFFQRAGLDFALISGDANRSPLRSGNGVSAVAERLDFLADGAHLRFRSVRLHNH